jgi:hypothetical protein
MTTLELVSPQRRPHSACHAAGERTASAGPSLRSSPRSGAQPTTLPMPSRQPFRCPANHHRRCFANNNHTKPTNASPPENAFASARPHGGYRARRAAGAGPSPISKPPRSGAWPRNVPRRRSTHSGSGKDGRRRTEQVSVRRPNPQISPPAPDARRGRSRRRIRQAPASRNPAPATNPRSHQSTATNPRSHQSTATNPRSHQSTATNPRSHQSTATNPRSHQRMASNRRPPIPQPSTDGDQPTAANPAAVNGWPPNPAAANRRPPSRSHQPAAPRAQRKEQA